MGTSSATTYVYYIRLQSGAVVPSVPKSDLYALRKSVAGDLQRMYKTSRITDTELVSQQLKASKFFDQIRERNIDLVHKRAMSPVEGTWVIDPYEKLRLLTTESPDDISPTQLRPETNAERELTRAEARSQTQHEYRKRRDQDPAAKEAARIRGLEYQREYRARLQQAAAKVETERVARKAANKASKEKTKPKVKLTPEEVRERRNGWALKHFYANKERYTEAERERKNAMTREERDAYNQLQRERRALKTPEQRAAANKKSYEQKQEKLRRAKEVV